MAAKPYRRNLVIRQGAAQGFLFVVRDINGSPIVLSGWGARAMIRGAYADLVPLVTLGLGTGLAVVNDPTSSTLSGLQVQLSSTQATTVATSGIGKGVWDLWLDPSGTPDGSSFMLIKGEVVVEPTATR
jgi:hypothetical protein